MIRIHLPKLMVLVKNGGDLSEIPGIEESDHLNFALIFFSEMKSQGKDSLESPSKMNLPIIYLGTT